MLRKKGSKIRLYWLGQVALARRIIKAVVM
jgi:hypothetical protein